MKKSLNLMQFSFGSFAAVLSAILLAGCQSGNESSPAAAASGSPAAAAVASAPAVPAFAGVHIKAGPGPSFKDADGNTWLPEQGFPDGDTAERPDIEIANTK